MKSFRFVKLFAVSASFLLVAACASNDTATRTEQSSERVSGDTYETGSTVRVGQVDRQTASGQSTDGGFGTGSASASSNSGSDSLESIASMGTLAYFDFDQSTLKGATRDMLQRHASRLMKTTEVIRLEGHADELGTREYNMALGERRAKAVMNYLSSLGVPRSRMETVSYGEEKPVVLGSGESARSQNRRVEIVYN